MMMNQGDETGTGRGRGGGRGEGREKWRMLEVGALRVDNAASRSGLFTRVERIDLQAQQEGILTQDFMERPMPMPKIEDGDGDEERFDVVSLSLVLNYVGDPVGRGDMLRRVGAFLRRRKGERRRRRETVEGGVDGEREKGIGRDENEQEEMLPGLFLVLPAPCVTNSRYLDEERLEAMMRGLGYTRVRRKMSLKLVYYFWRWEGREEDEGDGAEGWKEEEDDNDNDNEIENDETKKKSRKRVRERRYGNDDTKKRLQWGKEEIRRGGGRNNFAVVIK